MPEMIHLYPSDWVIAKLGGVASTARKLGVIRSAVCHWEVFVPQRYHKKIMAISAREGLGIQYRDLVEGHDIPVDELPKSVKKRPKVMERIQAVRERL